MAGRPGRSGGHNRIPVETHLRRGTFVPSRHGHLLAESKGPAPTALHAPVTRPDTDPPWAPETSDLAALGEPGRRFLTAMLNESDVSLVQGVLLLEASHVLDHLTSWRAQASTNAVAARLALQHAKTFAGLLASLRTW